MTVKQKSFNLNLQLRIESSIEFENETNAETNQISTKKTFRQKSDFHSSETQLMMKNLIARHDHMKKIAQISVTQKKLIQYKSLSEQQIASTTAVQRFHHFFLTEFGNFAQKNAELKRRLAENEFTSKIPKTNLFSLNFIIIFDKKITTSVSSNSSFRFTNSFFKSSRFSIKNFNISSISRRSSSAVQISSAIDQTNSFFRSSRFSIKNFNISAITQLPPATDQFSSMIFLNSDFEIFQNSDFEISQPIIQIIRTLDPKLETYQAKIQFIKFRNSNLDFQKKIKIENVHRQNVLVNLKTTVQSRKIFFSESTIHIKSTNSNVFEMYETIDSCENRYIDKLKTETT